MNKLIWCEVTCGKCGRAASTCGYYSPDRIKRLKIETKNWVHDDYYRVLCPECKVEVEIIRTRNTTLDMCKHQAYIERQRKEVEYSLDESFF